ncbi:MAG TPA: RES family NAD+ phosphorylase [Longimicrobiales bacterium]|nr:RES family NAD+ phosphorylase [Longimicrobiales bacterium]
MRIFRITKAPHADLTGEGGLHASGRWHRRGRRVVYAADSRALAILEALVHLDPEDVPDDLVLLTIDVPDDLPREDIDVAALPADWQGPLHPACLAAGDAWLAAARTPLLRVPSVMAHEEHTFLLNPAHPDAGRIAIQSRRDFTFDPRLLEATPR